MSEPIDTYIVRQQGRHWVATCDGISACEGVTPDAALIAAVQEDEDFLLLRPVAIGEGNGLDDVRGSIDVSIEPMTTTKNGLLAIGDVEFGNRMGGKYTLTLTSEDMIALGRWLIRQAHRHQPSDADIDDELRGQ